MSSNTEIIVAPVALPTRNVSRVIIDEVRVTLYSNATCRVLVYADDGSLVGINNVTITPEQYDNWGGGPDGDLYFEDIVLQNLGYSRTV